MAAAARWPGASTMTSLVRAWRLPHPALRHLIDRYWVASGTAATPLPALMPGTGVEVFFHLCRPFLFSCGADVRRAPAAHLGYLRPCPLWLGADDDYSFLAVRIRSGALRHLCRAVPASGLSEPLAVAELWGREADEIAERLREAGALDEKIRLLDGWLLSCLDRYGRHDRWLDLAVDRLYYDHATVRVAPMAAQLALSRRHFERVFKDAIGCSPKAFQRIARFQQTVRDLSLSEDGRYLDAALAHGYYDQAHFIREFEHFVGVSPGRFWAEPGNASHFYNASVRPRS